MANTRWRCCTCGSNDKPGVVPGLQTRSMVTVAEFCSDKCRDKYLNKPEYVILTFKLHKGNTQNAADLISRCYKLGALDCVPSGEGDTYILRATFPAVSEWDF